MTMDTVEKSVELSHPVDFLIFTNSDITITNSELNLFLACNIVEREKNIATFKLQEGLASETVVLKEGMTCTAAAAFKSSQLKFDVAIINFNPRTRTLVCEIPKVGYIFNQRMRTRTRFADTANLLNAELTADTINGTVFFQTENLEDFTFKSLSLVIGREQGLVLPGDFVANIDIYNQDGLIYKGSGEVVRINPRSKQQDELLVVVQIHDPTTRPNQDIHSNERKSDRVALINKNEGFIEFYHPFAGAKITAQLVDLSNSGLSILVPTDKYALVPGLILADASLQLPLRPRLSVTLKVRGINEQPQEESGTTYRVSMAFDNPTMALTREVSAFVQQSVSNNLYDARPEDDHDLWEFYFETGFIYESKRRQLQGYSEVVRRTQQKLLNSETPLLKKIVYKENGKILGNGTAIKIYENTLMLQHLNAIKTHSGNAAKAIIKGMTTYFLDRYINLRNDNRFVCTYYRPENLFPALVFGETKNLIANDTICWQQDYNFCVRQSKLSVYEHNSSITSREATESDFANLELLLIKSKKYNLMRVEGLVRESFTSMAVFDEYASIGLYHYRRVFVSQDAGTNACCYAVCTYSSPGLNLSELTNSVKIYFSTNLRTEQIALMNEVIQPVVDSYAQTDMRDPVLLLDKELPAPNGFKIEKIYTWWVMDLYYPKLFKDSTDMIFNRLKDFIRKKKAVN